MCGRKLIQFCQDMEQDSNISYIYFFEIIINSNPLICDLLHNPLSPYYDVFKNNTNEKD